MSDRDITAIATWHRSNYFTLDNPMPSVESEEQMERSDTQPGNPIIIVSIAAAAAGGRRQKKMANQVIVRTEVAGIEVEVRAQRALDRLYRQLGGRTVEASDKDVTLEFPSAAAARQFAAAVKAQGGIVE